MTMTQIEDVEPDEDDIAWARDDMGALATEAEVYGVASRRATERASEPCDICGLAPCDCDGIYDRWKERDL